MKCIRSTRPKWSIGYFILIALVLVLMQTLFFASQSENLYYCDVRTRLKAGKVVDLLPGACTITVRLRTDKLEGRLPPGKIGVMAAR